MIEDRTAPHWRWMLRGAALYNLVVAVPGLLLAASTNDRIVALLVGCFGLVYAMVSRQPARLGPVLWAGVIGKLGVVALLLPEVRAGLAAPGTGWILLGDLAFTAAFLAFLLRRGANQTA